MINLIPPEGHKAVKREYALRVGAALGFLFSGVMILLGVALIPTYILIEAQIATSESEVARETGETEALSNAKNEIRSVKTVLAQLKATPQSVLMSSAIEEIQKNAPANVVFKNFSISAVEGVVTTLLVQGVAPTRESLAKLRDALVASDLFENAEVPISDLARETNLPFTLTVTLSPQQ